MAIVEVGEGQRAVDAHDLAPQLHVLVHGPGQVGAHGVDQHPVGVGADVVGREGGLQAGVVAAGVAGHDVVLDHAVQQHGEGVLVLAQGAEEGVGGLLAHQVVVVGAQGGETAEGHRHRLALGADDGRELDVHAQQRLVGVAGGGAHVARQGHQALLGAGQGVGLLPPQLAEVVVVLRQLGLLAHEVLDDLRDRSPAARARSSWWPRRRRGTWPGRGPAWCGPRCCPGPRRTGSGRTCRPCTAGAGWRWPRPRVQQGGGGLAQVALELVQLGDVGGDGGQLGLPGRLVREDVRRVPAVVLGHVGARGAGIGDVGVGGVGCRRGRGERRRRDGACEQPLAKTLVSQVETS